MSAEDNAHVGDVLAQLKKADREGDLPDDLRPRLRELEEEKDDA